jgi:glutamate synthase domain-containing protein 2
MLIFIKRYATGEYGGAISVIRQSGEEDVACKACGRFGVKANISSKLKLFIDKLIENVYNICMPLSEVGV